MFLYFQIIMNLSCFVSLQYIDLISNLKNVIFHKICPCHCFFAKIYTPCNRSQWIKFQILSLKNSMYIKHQNVSKRASFERDQAKFPNTQRAPVFVHYIIYSKTILSIKRNQTLNTLSLFTFLFAELVGPLLSHKIFWVANVPVSLPETHFFYHMS